MSVFWLIALIVLMVVLQHRRFGGTRVSVDDNAVTVEPVGMDKVWSLTTELVLPLADVTDVRVDDWRNIPAGWKLPGTCLPGWIIAGRYVKDGVRSFWNVHRAERVLVLDVVNDRYDRIVVEVDDPVAVARQIMAAAPHGI